MKLRRGVRRLVRGIAVLFLWPPLAAAESPAPEPPPLTATRYETDYSYLGHPQNRTGVWWEPLKFIPLDERGWAYLTLGDEARLRFESYGNNDFQSEPLSPDSYLRYRHMPVASLNLGPNLRLVAQAMVTYAVRNEQTKNPAVDQTGVEPLQALIQAAIPISSLGEVSFRVGRQVLIYGSGRLINAGPNVRLSFDGAVARWERNNWRLDCFFVRPEKRRFDSFNDSWDTTRRLWSLYATHTFDQGFTSGLDLYYVGFENTKARFNQGEGRELRHTFGSRVFGNIGHWLLDVEGHLQTGRFADSNVLAWGALFESRYTFSRVVFSPWWGTRLTALSGDASSADKALGTFNAMFPEGGYYGETGVVGPGNLLGMHQAIGVELGRGVSAKIAGMLFWRQRLGDGIYGIGGQVVRPDGGSRSRFIGTQGELTVSWAQSRNLSFYAVGGVLVPGAYVADTGSALTVRFFATHASYAF